MVSSKELSSVTCHCVSLHISEEDEDDDRDVASVVTATSPVMTSLGLFDPQSP